MTSSSDKWPTRFAALRIPEATSDGAGLPILLSGVLDREQLHELRKDIAAPALHEYPMEPGGRYIISCVLSDQEATALCQTYAVRAREWRGRYIVLAKELVQALEKVK